MTVINDASSDSPLRSPGIRALLLLVALVAGLAMWLQFGAIEWAYGAQFWGVVVFAVLAVIPPVARPIGKALQRVRRLSPRARRLVALGIFVANGGTLLYFNFGREQSDLDPSVCDEYSYLVQAQLLAHGRLWSAPHEHPEFFTTFQVIGAPVYGSIYFPGTALWIAPWSMLDPAGGYAWIGPWLAASLAVMLMYLITAELLDDLAGILAAILTFAVPIWRGLAMVIMGQCIAAMLGLLVIWLFLRWRSDAKANHPRRAMAWGAAAAFFATWAVLTRPVDGLAYSLPVLIAVFATRGIAPRLRGLSIAAALVGMVPLGALQLSFNKAVSGSMLKTPFSWYNDKYLPGTSYGAESRDHERMKQVHPHTAHFHFSYQEFTRPFVEDIGKVPLSDLAHERFRVLGVAGTTHGMTLIWAPFALLLLLPRRGLPVAPDDPDGPVRWVGGWHAWLLAAPLPLMWLLYLPYGFFLYQYAGAAIPTFAFWEVAGAYGLASFVGMHWRQAASEPIGEQIQPRTEVLDYRRVKLVVPRPWWHHGVFVFATGALLALSTRGIPGFFNTQSEDWYRVPELRQIDEILAKVPGPAVVLITPPGGDAPPEAEAVYNLGVITPDRAQVIRAHDLGVRNIDLIEYYAQRDPQRRVYHYHRRTRKLTDLGTAAEIAARPQQELHDLFSELSAPWRRMYAALLREYGYDASEMPFEAPPQSQWDEAADEKPAAPDAGQPATRPSE